MAEYAFRAYTKQRNNDEFNKVKALASDKTNLAFRTVVQTGGKDGTEDLESDKKKTVSNSHVMAELGLKMKAPRKRKTREEIMKGANDTSRLTKTYCAAVLTLGFACKTATGSKLGELQRDLKEEIEKGMSENPFGTSLAETSSSKRQKTGETAARNTTAAQVGFGDLCTK